MPECQPSLSLASSFMLENRDCSFLVRIKSGKQTEVRTEDDRLGTLPRLLEAADIDPNLGASNPSTWIRDSGWPLARAAQDAPRSFYFFVLIVLDGLDEFRDTII